MKKVRLFAVAAAMGMFASTVSAADPITKDAYVATWGAVDEIIKVDVGDKVVAPTAEIKVVKETRTTDSEYASSKDSLGLVDSTVCYKGFTNEEGVDSNGDGYVDAKMLFAKADQGVNNWLSSDAKFFPSAKTALYYVGLGKGQVTGGRFLAPGAAANKTYALNLAHKHLADEDAVLTYFEEEAKLIKIVKDDEGYIKYVDINSTDVTDAKGKVVGTVAKRVVSKNTRYSDDEIKSAVVKALVNGSATLVTTADYEVKYVNTKNYTVAQEEAATPLTYKFTLDGENYTTVAPGSVLIVKEDRYGNLVPVVATTSNLPGAQGTTVGPVPNKIVVALDVSSRTETQYVKYMTITPATPKKYTAVSEYVWDDETGTFSKVAVGATDDVAGVVGYYWANEYDGEHNTAGVVDTDHLDLPAHTYGLYYLDTPANTSDKIVIYTNDIEITGINTKNGTMTIKYATDKELTVSAVKLDGVWYPAVDTEAELVKVMEKVLDLGTLAGDTTKDDDGITGTPNNNDSEFDTWAAKYVDAAKDPRTGWKLATRTNAKGEKEEFTPANALQHYKGTFCTYKVAEGTEATATVTSNADAVDTSVAGVKTLTLTAKVGEEVVGTKEVKVVVAPKYERTYKNGKVATLKAFHLNGNLYAVYNYDWAAKTYTATFYAQDGVTVASTANGSL